MKLPAALEPWAIELARLSVDSGRALGPWLQRLALALGPRSRHGHGVTGEVDGFRGLARRGSPEHLLISHWLLADEMPDEFLRRASEGELLYLERAHREPTGATRCVVLFDSGPTQIGGPRLAHLALLVVLARRAREAGSTFAWGSLQAPAQLRALESKHDVRALLDSRSPLPVAASDLERWVEALADPGAGDAARYGAEVWIVGPRSDDAPTAMGPLGLRASRIEIEEEPHGSALVVRVRRRGSPRTSVCLDLPAPDVCVRVLRDPYPPRRRTPEASEDGFDLTRGLLFSENGRMLIAAASDGSFVARSIPTSPRDHRRRTLRLGIPEEQVVLGLHASRRRLVAVTTDGHHVHVYDTSGTVSDERHESHPELVLEEGSPLRECWRLDHQLVFTDPHGRCYSLSAGDDSKIEFVSRDNAVMARLANRFYWLARSGRTLLWQEGGHRPLALRALGSFRRRGLERASLSLPWIRPAACCGSAWRRSVGGESEKLEPAAPRSDRDRGVRPGRVLGPVGSGGGGEPARGPPPLPAAGPEAAPGACGYLGCRRDGVGSAARHRHRRSARPGGPRRGRLRDSASDRRSRVSDARRSRAIWRGVFPTRGLFLDHAGLGEGRRRERVLHLWESGSSLYEWEGGWILIWPGERMLDSRRAPGALVRARGAGLSATPRAPDACVPDSIWVTWRGCTTEARISEMAEVDPSTWIDVGPSVCVELSAPPREPAPLELVAEERVGEPQEILGELGIGESPDAQRLRAAFATATPTAGVSARLAALWRRWRRDTETRGDHDPMALPGPRASLAPGRSWAISSWIARLGGRVYTRHLRRLARLFESGDLDAALRHAVPLGGEIGARLRLALRPASPRRALRFTSGARGSAVPVGDRVLDVLTGLYESAYHRLVAAGRIEEAAFVMGELLSRPEEAVALLEREGRARAAAELAELRRLPAGLVIRQWMLAGQVDRAVAIARRTGAFHDAVVRLGASHEHEVRRLRVLWANTLAHHGDYTTAVDVLWPVEDARGLAARWIQLGMDLGGEGAARMLVYWAWLAPESGDDALARARALLADASPEHATERMALAEELLQRKHRVARTVPEPLRGMASAACRAMARDWELDMGGCHVPVASRWRDSQTTRCCGSTSLGSAGIGRSRRRSSASSGSARVMRAAWRSSTWPRHPGVGCGWRSGRRACA